MTIDVHPENSALLAPITVKCLTEPEKDVIVMSYQTKAMNQKELARFWDVSERTINRVLIERGQATPVQRVEAEAKKVMALLKKHGIEPYQLPKILANYSSGPHLESTRTGRMSSKTPALLMASPQA